MLEQGKFKYDSYVPAGEILFYQGSNMQQSLRLFVLATMTANASAWWRDDIKVDNRAPLPFPVPDDWTYVRHDKQSLFQSPHSLFYSLPFSQTYVQLTMTQTLPRLQIQHGCCTERDCARQNQCKLQLYYFFSTCFPYPC